MAVRPGDSIGQLLSSNGASDVILYGTVTSVGANTVDVLLDGGSGPITAALTGGSPSVGERVAVQVTPSGYSVAANGTQSGRSSGLVVVNINSVSGGAGTPTYPLAHASTHASGGTDAVSPASIGASTSSDISTAIAAHAGTSDPHTGYVLASGTRAIAGNISTHSLIPVANNAYDLGSTSYIWRKAYISELDAFVQKISTKSAVQGSLMVAKNAGAFPNVVGAADAAIDFGTTMVPNDFVVLQSLGQLEYMQVGTLISGTSYNVTRNLDGSGANAWPSGSVWIDYGYNGDGYIVLDASTGTPLIAARQSGATYNTSIDQVVLDDTGIAMHDNNTLSWPLTHGTVSIKGYTGGGGGTQPILRMETQPAAGETPLVEIYASGTGLDITTNAVSVGNLGGTPVTLSASGDVFAGKGKGVQAQISDVNIYTASATLTLTNSYQDVAGATVTFTSDVAEYALINVVSVVNLAAGTAACNVGDRIRTAVNVDTTDDAATIQIRALVSSATQTNQSISRWYKITLAAASHTIKLRATNVDGNRGQMETGTMMMVWRIAQ